MAERVKAPVTPELLIWGRKTIGYDINMVATKIKVKAHQIKDWESGEDKPTVAQLKRLAHVYKRPMIVFYLNTPPEEFPAIADFRRLPDAAEARSPEMNYAIRKAYERRQIVLDLMEAEGNDFIGSASISTPKKRLAERIRGWLDIPLHTQHKWRDKYTALSSWIGAVEDKGILVFQEPGISLTEMRGFSISQKPLAVIVINGKDDVRARIFTLVHELVHLFLDRGGICTLEGHKDEVYCNAVSGLMLVPTNPLLELYKQSTDIEFLARKFWVSREVILRRLLDTGKISRSFYTNNISKSYHAGLSQGAPIIPYYRKKLKENGRLFTSIVLDAYHDHDITLRDASAYLDLGFKHFPKTMEEVYK